MQPNPFGSPQPAPAAPNPFGGQPSAPPAPPVQPQQQPYADPWAQQPPAAPAAPPQQQYAPPAPQQQAQPAPGPFPGMGPGAGTPVGGDPFGAPAPQVDRPRVQDLFGCLLMIMPKRVERGIPSRFKNNEGQTTYQDRMTADVVVLYGNPSNPFGGNAQQVPYGGSPEKLQRGGRPHDRMLPVPSKIPEMYISNKGLISQCRDALEQTTSGRGQGMVLGWLDVGEAQGENAPPYLLREYDERAAQLARAWLAQNPVI